jgi:hypothetical protein
VAVGDSSTILYADMNAAAWTAVSSPPSANYTQVIYDGTRFVAVGGAGTVVTGTAGCAPDCIPGTWTKVPTTGFGALSLAGIAKIGSLYMVVTTGGLAYTSSDLSTWTLKTATALNAGPFSITASQGITPAVFLISGALNSAGKVVTSTDGTTWTTVANPTVGSSTVGWTSVYGGPGEYIGIGTYNGLWSSPGTISWSGGYGQTGYSGAVAWDGTNYLGALADRFISWNGSASTWTAEAVTPPANATGLTSVAGNGTTVVAVVTTAGTGNALMEMAYSGSAWTQVSATTLGGNPDKVFHGGGKFLASLSTVFSWSVPTSPDGVTWTAGTLYNLGPTLNDVIYDGAKFVGVGSYAAATCAALVSTDGLSWVGYDAGLPSTCTAIAPLGTGYMVGGYYGLTGTRAANY